MTDQRTGWNPQVYLTFSSERLQPLVDLVARVRHPQAQRIVDLGCGAGNGVPVLRTAWPQAQILGIDSSAEMLERARSSVQDARTTFLQADIRTIGSEGLPQGQAPDVIVSNAALQWLPEHRELLPGLMGLVAPGGIFAVQVPGNFQNPSHRLLYEFAAAEPYAQHIDQSRLLQPTADPQDYMHDVAQPGWEVEAWETTYYHTLQGEDPVFTWISATAAKPVLEQLPEGLGEQFVAQYKAALREAYPASSLGTVLPFRRLFFIARRR
ncbi:methyltransferase domain-containing protein [Nesterenkonia alkaliphila]|uniref:Methyltransferase domain-containing protein n=1 Tax=Nesterenkonia alkaliphila TaxID=1463631 RepID=A0A7K1UHL9_9MICC|nr:methyltransferase domain-containing protein [Nesterenkonia alkaliphila]MVT25967.1 methyltransferase domain-containing protein [Nesterenkonia alkaliphila]GFZ95645.1 trans-aconitate 2-methyltransferase [Nesterenkonia alkaliphila]